MNPTLVEFLKHADLLPQRQNTAAPAETGVSAGARSAAGSLTEQVLEGDYRLTGAVLFCLSRQAGLRVHLLSRDARSPYRFSSYVRSFHLLAPDCPEEVFVAFVQNAARATGAEVLVPVDVAGMRFVIAHRAALETATRLLPLPAAASTKLPPTRACWARSCRSTAFPRPIPSWTSATTWRISWQPSRFRCC